MNMEGSGGLTPEVKEAIRTCVAEETKELKEAVQSIGELTYAFKNEISDYAKETSKQMLALQSDFLKRDADTNKRVSDGFDKVVKEQAKLYGTIRKTIAWAVPVLIAIFTGPSVIEMGRMLWLWLRASFGH